MQKKSKTILTTVVLLISLFFALQAQAESLDDLFNEYGFYANITDPGAYEAQTQGFITGGSLNVRTRYKDVRWGSVSPPSLSAGCGGVDMFFGGFNFINKDELVDMMKAIGQNSLGYAFELGLESVCPTCNSVIKHLADKAQWLNKFNRDSCTAAKSLVNGLVPDDWAESTINRCQKRLIKLGIADDADEARKKCINDNSELGRIYKAAKDNASANTKSKEIEPGKATGRALRHLDKEERTLAVNLLGTYVYIGPKDNGQTPDLIYMQPLISVKDLLYGNPGALIMYSKTFEDSTYASVNDIEVDQINKINIDNIPDADIRQYLKEYLDVGFYEKMKDHMYSVHDKLKSGDAFTDDEKKYVNATTIPVIKILETTRQIDGMAGNTIDLLSGLLGCYMIEELISGYAKEAMTNAHNQSQVNLSMFMARLEEVKLDVNRQLQVEISKFEHVHTGYKLAQFFDDQLYEKVSHNLLKVINSAGNQ